MRKTAPADYGILPEITSARELKRHDFTSAEAYAEYIKHHIMEARTMIDMGIAEIGDYQAGWYQQHLVNAYQSALDEIGATP